MKGMDLFAGKRYRNVFAELGKSEAEIEERLAEIVDTFFYREGEKVYFPVGEDMAYIEDTGNEDARTEGISYGMMMCVQLDKKEEFDRLWKWAKTYMWMEEGENEGYFAWSCAPDGTKNAYGPAPDGEEFFAMALFFAAHRWGNGEGIFDYEREARKLLRACLHKGENGRPGQPMWNKENKLILFVPGCGFTDPSYHLPHFYELFALWADEGDRGFWKEAAAASREYLAAACHPATGMSAEYAEFDGRPVGKPAWSGDRHDWFYSDSYRTAANIGLDYEWFGIDAGQRAAAERLQRCLGVTHGENPYRIFEVDGTPLEQEALHPVAIAAATAQAGLAVPKDAVGPVSVAVPGDAVGPVSVAVPGDAVGPVGVAVPGDAVGPVGVAVPGNAVGSVSIAEHQEAGGGVSDAGGTARMWAEKFWNLPMRTGVRRYYDNCLYVFAFLALSGRYRIW